MMTSLSVGHLIMAVKKGFSEAPLNYATLWRWVHRGVSGVRLATSHVGGQCCTTETDLREFFRSISAAKCGQPAMPMPVVRTPARREKDISAAKKRLAAVGI
jgi:hypothetical protein